MPRANQYLLLYVLDLLSVFARKSDKNLMTATSRFVVRGSGHSSLLIDLAVIFRPGLISHPDHELSPQEHQLSQDVLEFLIAHQDWFMLDIPPPPPSSTPGTLRGGASDPDDIVVVPSSDVPGPGVPSPDVPGPDVPGPDQDQSLAGIGTWKLAGIKRKVSRRRTLENSGAPFRPVV